MLYYVVMSGKLLKMMNLLILREGSAGKAQLSLAAKRGERMIDRYLKGEVIPSSDVAYRLALACGATETEAVTLAGDTSRAKETA